MLLNQGAVTVEVHTQLIFFLKQQRNGKEENKSPFNSCNSNNEHTEREGRKQNTCFGCGSEDPSIANIPKPDTSEKKLQ